MKRHQHIGLARRLRHNETDAERLLWSKLRNAQLGGVKFRRQQPIENYIVDFINFDRKLIIEVDGGQHDEATAERDKVRTEYLKSYGYKVLRFWNTDALMNIEGVLATISEALQ